jgi:hypothetical protein
MFGEQLQEIVAPDEGDLARMKCFRRHLIRSIGENGHQAENFSRLGDPQDQRLSRARTNGELHLSGAKHEHAARILLFKVEHRAARIGGG